MASVVKDLSVLASVLEMSCASDAASDGHGSQFGSAHYISGTGTIILEGTHFSTDPAVWAPLVDLANPPVAIPALTAADIGVLKFFRTSGLKRIRARNSVVGVANRFGLGVD